MLSEDKGQRMKHKINIPWDNEAVIRITGHKQYSKP